MQAKLIINSEYKSYVPRPSNEDYEGLKKSIKDNGFYSEFPIIANEHNEILDGYTRYQICEELGIEPKIEIKKFKDKYEEASFVISVNLSRRHLKPEQRAMLNHKIYELEKEHSHSGGDRKSDDFKNQNPKVEDFDLYERIANKTGQNKKTVERDIQYAKAVKANPKLEGQAVNKVLRSIRIEKKKADLKEIELPKGTFNVILADPPWLYDFSKSDSRKIENQYPTMELEKIKALGNKLPIDKDAILFLWVTAPKLEQGLEVLREWGFEYKTNAVWDKEIIGMGYYFRSQHEHLLVGIKGKMNAPIETKYSSIIKAKRNTHSTKPDIVYEMIETLYPKQAYLEVFARSKKDNWEVWGNEVS